VEILAMPLYEYDCPKCGRFEVLQRMSDAPLEKHECGKKVKKVLSAGSFAFKGSGFYATDYKKTSQAPSCAKPKGEACSGCPGNKAA
jgi:putative FmdB family regulatory protein